MPSAPKAAGPRRRLCPQNTNQRLPERLTRS